MPNPTKIESYPYFAAGAALLAAVVIAKVSGQSFSVLSRDTAVVAQQVWYAGLISNLGILGWAVAAIVCLSAQGKLARSGADGRSIWHYRTAGILTLWLMCDDLLMLHEEFIPRYLGLTSKEYFPVLIAVVIAWCVMYRSYIRQGRWGHLLLAAACFALSLAMDVLSDRIGVTLPGHSFVEDGTKFMGISAWLAYFVFTGRALVDRRTLSAESPSDHG